MADDFRDSYGDHGGDESRQGLRERVKVRVMAPAIALICIAVLGLGVSAFNIVFAFGPKRPIDPNAPEFLKKMQESTQGPTAAILQGVFFVVNAAIIVGAVFMLRFDSWAMGLVASILAMVNLGSCCCILGLPVGIWSLVILLQNDVKQAFSSS